MRRTCCVCLPFWMPSVDSRGFIWFTIICDFGFLNPRLFYFFSFSWTSQNPEQGTLRVFANSWHLVSASQRFQVQEWNDSSRFWNNWRWIECDADWLSRKLRRRRRPRELQDVLHRRRSFAQHLQVQSRLAKKEHVRWAFCRRHQVDWHFPIRIHFRADLGSQAAALASLRHGFLTCQPFIVSPLVRKHYLPHLISGREVADSARRIWVSKTTYFFCTTYVHFEVFGLLKQF
jgi:hypothetical protein